MADVVIKDNTRQYLAVAENEVEKAITRGTIRVQREARRLVSRFPSPPPSLPGEPPHLDTGTLSRSIDMETFRVRRTREFVGRVGSNLKYARALELGYPPNNLDERPYLRPALDKHRRKIVAEINEAMRKAGK